MKINTVLPKKSIIDHRPLARFQEVCAKGIVCAMMMALFGYSAQAQSTPPTVLSLLLIDADRNETLFAIGEANFIDLSQLPANLSIQAITSPATVGSVVFALSGTPGRNQVENISPYALFGDNPRGDFNGGTLPLGGNSLSVTPYSRPNGQGLAGRPFVIQLNVARSGFAFSTSDPEATQNTPTRWYEDGLIAPALTLYPNPSEGYLRATGTLMSTEGHLAMYNNLGEKILEKTWQGKLDETLDLSAIVPGTYLFRIKEDSRATYRRIFLR